MYWVYLQPKILQTHYSVSLNVLVSRYLSLQLSLGGNIFGTNLKLKVRSSLS